MPDPIPSRRYRFGVFEADTATGELRRQGIRIKINAQPFQVLCLLLSRPGELFTRDQIAAHLWPDGTFVDYDHGVNSAINRIREALGDSAANPRFIETLARRGYRFIAPVEALDARAGLNAREAEAAMEREAAVQREAATVEAEATVAAAEPTAVLAATPDPRHDPELPISSTVLATPEELPRTSPMLALTFFVSLEAMYLAIYIAALANLGEVDNLLSDVPGSTVTFPLLIVTAALLIPARAFVVSAFLFQAPRARHQFLRMWPFLAPADVLWALSPFLLLHHISFGLALACVALLVYSPFAQRSLVLMGAGVPVTP
jgi:DNA-binding winged helix-turn-helix (wHTH) protein